MRQAAISTGVQRSSVYDVTMYLLAGLLVIGLLANMLVRPVPRKWFMSADEVEALQQERGEVSVVQSVPVSAFSMTAVLAWAVVGLPILWGVWITLTKVAVMFR